MWLCIVEDTPVKDRDVGYLTCHPVADIADGDGCVKAIV